MCSDGLRVQKATENPGRMGGCAAFDAGRHQFRLPDAALRIGGCAAMIRVCGCNQFEAGKATQNPVRMQACCVAGSLIVYRTA